MHLHSADDVNSMKREARVLVKPSMTLPPSCAGTGRARPKVKPSAAMPNLSRRPEIPPHGGWRGTSTNLKPRIGMSRADF